MQQNCLEAAILEGCRMGSKYVVVMSASVLTKQPANQDELNPEESKMRASWVGSSETKRNEMAIVKKPPT